jgi:hypothetical protein
MKYLLWLVLVVQLAMPMSVFAQEPTALADSYGYDRNTIRLSDIPKDAPKFEDYPVESVFKGKIAAPDVSSYPRSKRFRTVIRKRAKAGVNFAGHYSLVAWGCGSACASWAIVDAQTGSVFHPANFRMSGYFNIDDAVGDTSEGWLVRYRANSKLLVVIGDINEDPALRGISYFVWEHNKLKRIRFVPRPNQESGIKK